MRTLLIALIAVSLVSGCKKKGSSAASVADTGGGGPATVERSGGGGGGVMGGRRAVGRAVDANELSQFAIAVESMMKEDAISIPPLSSFLPQLRGQAGFSNVIAAIDSGEFVWRDGASRGGLWGYGKNQDNGRRHPAIVGGKATRLDADELRQHLGG